MTLTVDTRRPILSAVAWGIRAPSPHNTQAWKFQPLSDMAALLYVDEERLLPATDPPARQIHIGAGCCIETLAVGMTTEGYDTSVEVLPDGPYGLDEIGHKPVAHIELRPRSATRPAPLADAIGRRQTNRKPYTGPWLTDNEADQIRSFAPPGHVAVSTFSDPDVVRPLLDIFYRAYEIEVTTRHLWDETRRWFRFNEQQRRTLRDGLSVPQSGVDGLKGRFIEWALRDGDPKRWFSRFSTRSILSTLRKSIGSGRGVVMLTTETNRQVDWILAGRAFARVHLGLTHLGLTCNPNSQVLQEYTEMAALQRQFNELVGVRDPQKVQMACRVGRAERAYVAPRRDPKDFILDAAD
jgi:hypothetical protein